MDKTLAGLVGVMGALTVIAPGQAATPTLDEAMQVETYADLLRPIPNASALLAKSDAAAAAVPEVLEVQYYYHHHHHHHHHRYYRPYYPVPAYGYYRPRYHHHHHSYYRGFGGYIR